MEFKINVLDVWYGWFFLDFCCIAKNWNSDRIKFLVENVCYKSLKVLKTLDKEELIILIFFNASGIPFPLYIHLSTSNSLLNLPIYRRRLCNALHNLPSSSEWRSLLSPNMLLNSCSDFSFKASRLLVFEQTSRIDSGVRPTTLSHCWIDGYCRISGGKDSTGSFALVTSCLEYNLINFP